ncbi:MAG: hypothetical protein ABSA94_03545 [Acidobacteriaceae bacterium]
MATWPNGRNHRWARVMVKTFFVMALLSLASLPAHAAVAWVNPSHTVCAQASSSTASQTCTLGSSTTAGNDVIVGVAWQNTAATIANVAGSAPSSFFFLYGATCNGTSECVATLVCHKCAAQTAVTTTMSAGTAFVTTVEEYSGVQVLGITGANRASSTTPGLTMTTGDANDWTVCATASLGSAGIPTAAMGTLRDANGTGTTSSDIAGAIVDNTAPSAGSVSCTDTTTSDPWAATGVELRSVTPETYIWPDCDSAHPCVVHHIDTVAAGTAENETPNSFKLTTVPSSTENLLTLAVTHVSTKTVTVTDNNGGNWQSAVTTTNAGDQIETQLLYVCGAAAGTNVITIQLSEPPAPGEVLQFSYNEVSGIAPSSCLDGATGANGLTGDLQPGSIATTADGDLVYNFGEETYNFPEEDNPIGWVMPDDNSALLMENAWDKFASQISVQAGNGAYNPTLYANADLNARNWNSAAAAFKPSAGAGTQPTGIHITRVMHYYNPPLPLTPAWIPFPSSGNAIVISSAYPSSGYEGDMTDVGDNQGDTWTRTPFTVANDDPQIYYTCLGSEASSRDLTIDWLPDTGTTHMIVYDIAGAKTTGGSTGCVGATVNSNIGTQPSTANASITGAPVITPDASNSVIIAVNQLGIGPPSGSLTPNVVFASIWATGMTDATNWDSGDCYGYIYTTSTSPISFDWQMANANGLTNGGSAYDAAAIEILPGAVTQTTPTVTVTPSASSITTAQSLSVAVTVSGGNGNPTPTGSVTLAGGGYTSVATTLSGGSATINIPAGSLAIGSDTLTVTYTPDSSSASTYNSASASASVTVTASGPSPAYSMTATAATVAPGGSATSTVTVTSNSGYAGTVTLTCALTAQPAGANDPPTCSATQTVTLSASTASAMATVTVSTTAVSSSDLVWPAARKRWGKATGGAVLALLVFLWIPARRRRWPSSIGVLLVATVLGSLAGCGTSEGGGGGGATNPGTTAGAYTITVTGTGSDAARTAATTTFTLTVN